MIELWSGEREFLSSVPLDSFRFLPERLLDRNLFSSSSIIFFVFNTSLNFLISFFK